jgi:hypothetical protein
MQTEGMRHPDITKSIVAFRNFADAPEKEKRKHMPLQPPATQLFSHSLAFYF